VLGELDPPLLPPLPEPLPLPLSLGPLLLGEALSPGGLLSVLGGVLLLGGFTAGWTWIVV